MTDFRHEPVLVSAVLDFLVPSGKKVMVDGTVGGGGHARALLEKGPELRLVGLDRDDEALAAAEENLKPFGERATLLKADFAELPGVLEKLGLPAVDGVLLDLGVSRHQLTAGRRGFSFREDAPLDMRMDPSEGESAAELLLRLSERELAQLIFAYGEEPLSRRIARAVVERRREKRPVRTTGELRELVEQVAGGRPAKIHPATRTFMALRIAVNRELERLERVLAAIPEALCPGGRAVVISYHSLEDRRVKEAFAREAKGCVCPPDLPVCACGKKPRLALLTRKPVMPGEAEVARNAAARSARLRAAERI